MAAPVIAELLEVELGEEARVKRQVSKIPSTAVVALLVERQNDPVDSAPFALRVPLTVAVSTLNIRTSSVVTVGAYAVIKLITSP